MVRILVGIFFVLHGLVHMLYFGQSARYFELQPGMLWPDGSWVLSRVLGNAAARTMANGFLVLAALGFVASGAAIFLGQGWWRSLVIAAALFSSLIYLLLWNGTLQRLDNQGAVGILINLAILAAVVMFRWPSFEF